MENYKIDYAHAMIILKYFRTSNDYINFIKVNKKYKDILESFKFNPIGNPELFPNIETQHFYNNNDFIYALPQMYRYLYWGEFTKEQETKIKKINVRKYKYNYYDNNLFIKDKLINKDVRKMIYSRLLNNSNFILDELVFDSDINSSIQNVKGNILEIYQDNNNNVLGIIKGIKNFSDDNDFTSNDYSIISLYYLDKNGNGKYFNHFNNNYILKSFNHILIKFNTGESIGLKLSINNNNSKILLVVAIPP